ncbi:MAG: preprotein translocase subunit SecE [Nitrosomonas sp.]|nr:MAG: preprotein translocase subunit SecE [Nitrosomonas sp.]
MNNLKLILAVLFAAIGVIGFFYFDQSVLVVRILSILIGLVLAAVTVKFTVQGQVFYVFCGESSQEIKKVVWPSRKEALQTAGVVFAFVIAMALFLWMVDAALMSLLKILMDRDI